MIPLAFTPDWLGGFFDGEGCIGVYLRNANKQNTIKYYVLVVCLAQSGNIGKQICESLKAIYGGSVYADTSSKKIQWKWTISSQKAGDFLYSLKPYLLNKKEEAELGFIFQGLSNKRFDNPEARELSEKIKLCKMNY